MIFLGGTSGFNYGQVVLQINLSVGQVDFLTKFDPRLVIFCQQILIKWQIITQCTWAVCPVLEYEENDLVRPHAMRAIKSDSEAPASTIVTSLH